MASAASDLARIRKGNERFNDEAKAWDSHPGVIESGRAAFAAISDRLHSQSRAASEKDVLEIGCGTGILTFLLAPHVRRIVAVDAAQGMIDVLKEKMETPSAAKNILPLAILLEDPEDPALPPMKETEPRGARKKFDVITSHQVLHHIPDLKAVLTTMYKCLGSGGCVMLTDFEDFGPEAKRFHPASRLEGVARHGINVTDMSAMMRDVGFVHVQVQPFWSSTKAVETFDGEFGAQGRAEPGQGEQMTFPYVLCYGEKAAAS